MILNHWEFWITGVWIIDVLLYFNLGDNLHEISKPNFLRKISKIIQFRRQRAWNIKAYFLGKIFQFRRQFTWKVKAYFLEKEKTKKKKKKEKIFPLQKHAYSNILRILPSKNEKFQIKNSDIFLISAQNLDCGYSLELPQWGSSNEYPQSMLLCRNKKNNEYPCKPQFNYIKVGFNGVEII